jgi:hypothetical protein
LPYREYATIRTALPAVRHQPERNPSQHVEHRLEPMRHQ